MNLQTVLDKLRSKAKVKQASDWAEYRKQVLMPLAQGREVDIDEVDVFLQRLGKTEEDLRADVDKLQRRLTTQAQLEGSKRNATRLRVVEAEIAKLDAEFAKLRSEYAAKIGPLAQERTLLSSSADPLYHENSLRTSVMDPELISALEQNFEARKALYPRRDWLQKQLHRNADDGMPTVKWKIESIEDEIESLSKTEGPLKKIGDSLLEYATGDRSSIQKRERVAELKEKLGPLFAERDAYEKELFDIERQLAKLDQENKELLAKTLEP